MFSLMKAATLALLLWPVILPAILLVSWAEPGREGMAQ